MKINFPKMQLKYESIEWAPVFGNYSIRFKDKNNKTHGLIIGPKYLPIFFGQGLFGLEEEYREKYSK